MPVALVDLLMSVLLFSPIRWEPIDLPVAQSVEHRAAMREVVSSTPAGPTLRVLKQLRRKCCLCNYIYDWLDLQVFSDKDYKP